MINRLKEKCWVDGIKRALTRFAWLNLFSWNVWVIRVDRNNE